MVCKLCNGCHYTKGGFQGDKQRFKCEACSEVLRRVIRSVDRNGEKSVCFLTQWASLQCVSLRICLGYRSGL